MVLIINGILSNSSGNNSNYRITIIYDSLQSSLLLPNGFNQVYKGLPAQTNRTNTYSQIAYDLGHYGDVNGDGYSDFA